MLPKFDYVRAGSWKEAVNHLASPGSRPLAGGTDLLGCLRDGVFDASRLVGISRLDELRGIRETDDGSVRIGALTTIAEIAESDLVRERYRALAEAASEVASPQLRNQGTLGGNLCQKPRCAYYRGEFHCAKKGGDVCYAFDGENAYHAIFGGGPCFIVHPSDTAPALVALDATFWIRGPEGGRSVPAGSFFVLPEQRLPSENVLEQGEIVTEVVLPPAQTGLRSSYRKVRERGAWDFALASLALAIRMDGNRVADARVVFGGVAPRPWRSEAVEQTIAGQNLNESTAYKAALAATKEAEPLGKNGYKVSLVEGIVHESLLAL
jgi:xanthine dehydrogenase YagS FAD-binding subunit